MKLRLTTDDFGDAESFYIARETLESAAYRRLSCAARAAHMEIVNLYRWQADGVVEISCEHLASRLGIVESAAEEVLKELLDAAIIERGDWPLVCPTALAT